VLLEKLDSIYEQFLKEGFTWVVREWKKYADFIGGTVKVAGDAEKLCGLALDVDDDGALVIGLEDGTVKRFFVGDVSLQITE
jgi:BirA family biotin operon repressor/biotin-[acetyl-CoA-carboxylase] ligase